MKDENPNASILELQQLSTLVYPERTGIDPIFVDFRLITRTANLIRLLAQVTRYCGILYIMNIPPNRADMIMKGALFTEAEIHENEALLLYFATATLAGVYSNIKTIFNQCFYGAKLYEIPMPLPIELFAPADFDAPLPTELLTELMRRHQLPEILYATDSSIFEKSAIDQLAKNKRIWQTRLFVISQCKLYSGGEITTR